MGAHKKDELTPSRATITADDGCKLFDLDVKITTGKSGSLSDSPQMTTTSNWIKSTTECSNRPRLLLSSKQKSLNIIPQDLQLRSKIKKKGEKIALSSSSTVS